MIPKDVVVHVNKQFHFTPDKVFDAWTVPAIARRWLFASKERRMAQVGMDARVGGKFTVQNQDNDLIPKYFGKYVELERPGHLAFSLESPLYFSGVTYVSIFILPKRYGCELSLTQTGVSPDKMEANWYRILQQLENVLNEKVIEQTVELLPLDRNNCKNPAIQEA
jgi:uncharacterized protein YndB with AHSA1/START domain